MLKVNPIERISIQKIRENPWFQENYPQYLEDIHEPSISFDDEIIGQLAQVIFIFFFFLSNITLFHFTFSNLFFF